MTIALWTSVTVIVTASLAVFWMRWQNKFKQWEKVGVKGPRPLPIVGNFLSFVMGNRLKTMQRWRDTYGKIYGIYRGGKRVLIISDPEVVRQICIKDFDKFPNHEVNEFSNDMQKNFIFFMQDDHWKRVRALMSPTFTSSKMRRMFRVLNTCAEDLLQSFKEQLPASGPKRAVVNIKDLYMLYTMDAITTCGYGLRLERSGATSIKTAASRNDFVRDAYKPFQIGVLRVLIFIFAPAFIRRSYPFKLWTQSTYTGLVKRGKGIMDSRRKSSKKYDDYVQLLLDAELQDTIELSETDRAENHHAGLSHESLKADQKRLANEVEVVSKRDSGDAQDLVGSKVRLSDLEILANVVFLLMVGLETTGTLLTNITYTLGFHPEIQDRLHDEVAKIAERDESKQLWMFDYESLTSCQYLDAVISETLRTLSPVLSMDRVASEDYIIEKYNLALPKGSSVLLDYYGIHSNPEYWPEPHKFDPERFMGENKDKIVPGTYTPFGIGPRHCIGMRFSLTETKLALAKILMSYKIEPAPDTKYPPEPSVSFSLLNLKKPLTTIVPRGVSVSTC